MTRWRHTVDLSDIWAKFDDGDLSVCEVADAAAPRLLAVPVPAYAREEWEEIIEEMTDLAANFSPRKAWESEQWFDGIMEEVWSFGDRHSIWINTAPGGV